MNSEVIVVKKKIFYIILFLIVITLVGCKSNETPKDSTNKLITAWQKKDFGAMYDMVSSETRNSMKKEEFVAYYKSVYDELKVDKIEIKADLSNNPQPDGQGQVDIPIVVSLNTISGVTKISTIAVMEKEDNKSGSAYYLKWDQKLILPELEKGDKVKVVYSNDMKAVRGEITDRNGIGLAVNGTVATIGIEPRRMTGDKKTAEAQIAQILGISADAIDKALSATYVKPDSFVTITTLQKSDSDKISKLMPIPGVEKRDTKSRVYPYKEATAHLIGYVAKVGDTDYDKYKAKGYSKEDYIGKTGLEQVDESRLKGTDGFQIYTVDSAGKTKKVIGQKAAVNGENIKLTIDIQMQKTIYGEFGSDAGNAVAINPTTGDVLAMVSSPSFDPNLFTIGMSDSQWKTISTDAKKPLISRFANTYTPGSTFKFVTAAIGLKTGKLTQDKTRNITGLLWQQDASWGQYNIKRVDDPKKPENLTDAFVYSDNIYFAQTALDIGKDAFLSESKNFGIGEKIPFVYPVQASQLVTSEGIASNIQLADSGYGQGKVQLSTLHLGLIYSSLVNGGNLLNPLLEIKDSTAAPSFWKKNVISAENLGVLKTDLLQVVENPSGTGHGAVIPGMTIAGKTGTAEVNKTSQSDTNGTENGWFVGVNTSNPKVLVTMMVEDVKNRGGSGYVVTKVRDILAQYGNK